MKAIYLKPGREKSLLRRHPWIFSGAVDKVSGNPKIGETVVVLDTSGQALAQAAYSPHSSIRARVWSFDSNAEINSAFFMEKMRIAINYRRSMQNIDHTENTMMRLIHGESDELPGLIVDQYGHTLVVQFLSAGPEFWREEIIEALSQLTGLQNIYERSDVDVRKLEGLEIREGVLLGDPINELIEAKENGLRFLVDAVHGQKTGFFIDQRDNRLAIQKYLNGKSLLNCFSYTGAFSVYALQAGAEHVASIESSEAANQLAARNIALNGLALEKTSFITGDAFHELRLMRDKAQSFDAIILDPPKFAPTIAQVDSAARGYKDINLLAFKLLKPGGILFTFSCSGGVSQSLFQKIVADAALDAGVHAQVIEFLSQSADHPVALNFPEGAYLKGLVCRIS